MFLKYTGNTIIIAKKIPPVILLLSLIFAVLPEILQDSSYGTHKYVTANGIKFHYVANGSEEKPLMLFLHGFPEVSFLGNSLKYH